jgi:hypothetical protein
VFEVMGELKVEEVMTRLMEEWVMMNYGAKGVMIH